MNESPLTVNYAKWNWNRFRHSYLILECAQLYHLVHIVQTHSYTLHNRILHCTWTTNKKVKKNGCRRQTPPHRSKTCKLYVNAFWNAIYAIRILRMETQKIFTPCTRQWLFFSIIFIWISCGLCLAYFEMQSSITFENERTNECMKLFFLLENIDLKTVFVS